MATTVPVSMVLRCGVWNRDAPGRTSGKQAVPAHRVEDAGLAEELDSMVLKRPKIALIFTSGLNQVRPIESTHGDRIGDVET